MTKGKWYDQIVKEFPKKPWFYNNNNTAIICPRSGHGSSYKHLHKIGIKEDPFCECEEIGDITHTIFQCPINKKPNQDLYFELAANGATLPASIHTILNEDNARTLNLLVFPFRSNADFFKLINNRSVRYPRQ